MSPWSGRPRHANFREKHIRRDLYLFEGRRANKDKIRNTDPRAINHQSHPPFPPLPASVATTLVLHGPLLLFTLLAGLCGATAQGGVMAGRWKLPSPPFSRQSKWFVASQCTLLRHSSQRLFLSQLAMTLLQLQGTWQNSSPLRPFLEPPPPKMTVPFFCFRFILVFISFFNLLVSFVPFLSSFPAQGAAPQLALAKHQTSSRLEKHVRVLRKTKDWSQAFLHGPVPLRE